MREARRERQNTFFLATGGEEVIEGRTGVEMSGWRERKEKRGRDDKKENISRGVLISRKIFNQGATGGLPGEGD